MPQAYNYKRITSTGVSVISISAFGVLHSVTLNQQATSAATASLCTIVESSAIAGSPNTIGIIQLNNSGVADYVYDILYGHGPGTGDGLAINIPNIGPVDITVAYT